MKNIFENDSSCVELSKYFMLFMDKICHKLDFLIYYHPGQKNFIISDSVLNSDYKYYKTTAQIKEEKPISTSASNDFNWQKKYIVLFNKEEPYEQHDGEWFYPDYYDCNHELTFKMSLPNLQKVLLCILKNPVLKDQSHIKEIFSTLDTDIFFPSETLGVHESMDLLFVNHLEQQYLVDSMLKDTSVSEKLINTLQKKSSQYLVDFFKAFGSRKDIRFKDFIFKVTDNQDLLTRIFENFPEYNKFLLKNSPTEFLSKKTQQVSIFKSFFNVENLTIKYHHEFNETNTQNALLNMLGNYSLKEKMQEKGITIHNVYYDYSSKSVISLIENKSILSIEKIEDFICEALTYMPKDINALNSKSYEPNLLKFFQYFQQNEVSLLNHTYIKVKPHKI